MTRGELLALGGLAAAAAACFAFGAKSAPGGSVKVPVSQTEDQIPFRPPPDRPGVGPQTIDSEGYVLTPHRYPATCGNDITALIHGGWSTAALPTDGDMLWLSQPPSEATI